MRVCHHPGDDLGRPGVNLYEPPDVDLRVALRRIWRTDSTEHKVRIVVVSALVVGVLLSACGARGGVQAAAATMPTTATLPSGIVVTSTDVAACRAASLQFQFIPNESYGAAGTTVTYIRIANVGGMPCSLEGYPKVSGLNSVGHPVARASDAQCDFCFDTPYYKPPIVEVAPGEAAYVKVFGYDVNLPNCAVYNALSVTPPGDDMATVVSNLGGFDACGGSFSVGYIRPVVGPFVAVSQSGAAASTPSVAQASILCDKAVGSDKVVTTKTIQNCNIANFMSRHHCTHGAPVWQLFIPTDYGALLRTGHKPVVYSVPHFSLSEDDVLCGDPVIVNRSQPPPRAPVPPKRVKTIIAQDLRGIEGS